MLVSMKEMLLDAKQKKYAIPAFDISNYEILLNSETRFHLVV